MGKAAARKNAGRKGTSVGKARRFVIQEHHASSLHWDFRLERDGVLVSWAVPKGLPMDKATNHLAVHVEDHPLEYGNFSGTIPQGEYGGGAVTIWDKGTYEEEKWSDREVMVVLHGKRAKGRYVLFATKGKNWMIHRMDEAPPGWEPLPELLPPMLAIAGALPTEAKGWAYEFKWDGVRAIAYVEGGRARFLSRNGNDLTGVLPGAAAARRGARGAPGHPRRRDRRLRRGRSPPLPAAAAAPARRRVRGGRRRRSPGAPAITARRRLFPARRLRGLRRAPP